MVNTFWSIGISDPFPDESTILEQENQLFGTQKFELEKYVYPTFRYIKGQSPMQIYMPSKQILLKLVRACIGCSNESELWFNNNND